MLCVTFVWGNVYITYTKDKCCQYQSIRLNMAMFNYNDVIMSVTESIMTGVSIVYSTVCSGADQIKHQSSASLAFVRGIHRWPVNSPHKGPVTRKCFHLMFNRYCLYRETVHGWPCPLQNMAKMVYSMKQDERYDCLISRCECLVKCLYPEHRHILPCQIALE